MKDGEAEEIELLDEAVRHLRAAGLTVEFPDAKSLSIISPTGRHLYRPQVKPKVGPATFVEQSGPDRQLVVSSFVSDVLADLWRDQDVHYVDAAGNMYLRQEGLLLDVRGRPRPKPVRRNQPARMFRASGLRILFGLLAGLEDVSAPYREISGSSGVSLGTVHWIFKELEEAGFISQTAGGRRLHRTRELLARWVEAYSFELWPRLTLARFDAQDPLWWTEAETAQALHTERAQWGGETAAHRINPMLRPGRAIVYADRIPSSLAARYRFRNAKGMGNVEIRRRFWHPREPEPDLLVPTPLIYADLIASADPRQRDAATQLRESDALLRRLDNG